MDGRSASRHYSAVDPSGARTPRTGGQVVVDVLLVFAASWFILAGIVVVDVDNQVFPPPTSTQRTEAVQAAAAFVTGFVLLAMALLRSRRDGWRVIVFRRHLPGVVLVALAFTALAAGLGAWYFGGAIALLIAAAIAVALLAVSTYLFRVR